MSTTEHTPDYGENELAKSCPSQEGNSSVASGIKPCNSN
jgi:hypothetical protein